MIWTINSPTTTITTAVLRLLVVHNSPLQANEEPGQKLLISAFDKHKRTHRNGGGGGGGEKCPLFHLGRRMLEKRT